MHRVGPFVVQSVDPTGSLRLFDDEPSLALPATYDSQVYDCAGHADALRAAG